MLNLLNKATLLSKEITELLNLGDWNKAQQLQQEREQLLNQLPNTVLPSDSRELEKINKISLDIKSMTKDQLDISLNRKDNLLQQIKNSNKSTKMKKAYGYKTN